MRKWHQCFWLFVLCITPPLYAQNSQSNMPFSGFVDLRNLGTPAFEFWQNELRKVSGTGPEMTWKIYNQLADDLGQVHYRAQQYFQGIPLENGVVVMHTQDGRILSFNGEIIPESMLVKTKSETAETARARALELFPADRYYWQDPEQNALLQNLTENPDTSWFPKGNLVYCPVHLNYQNQHILCWKFEIFALEPLLGQRVYISAATGELVAAEDLICHVDVKGSAVTTYSGTREINTDSVSPGNYRLREKVRGKGIETYNMKQGTGYGAAVDFTDADNYWNNANVNKDEVATDAHWGAEKTYDYYDTVFGRKSFDDNNAKIVSYVHYSSNYSNAFWNGSYMTYGDGNGSTWKPLTSIDVCGHEISHAVTTYTANLVYSYESGALNESFSDVFGNAIERWSRPTKWNWKMGEDFTTSGAGIRDMSNPIPYNNPKYYKGNKWYFGAGDNGGVHTNSGVQNYWFYLITDGVSGTNEVGNSFKIDTLGIVDASHIAYRNLSVYLTKNAQYADARSYSILAATDLFGNCSKQVIAVTNAWWACGVGAKYDSGYVKADFVADTLVCDAANIVKFNNLSTNSLNCKWYFGDGNTSSAFNTTHRYSGYGTYDIKLVAYSCFQNKTDSINKKAYVVVDSTFDICNAVLMPVQGTDSVIKCFGFIYDDGGEGNYGALRQTNLKVKIPGATSIKFRFLVLDYENGYDSIVLFKNTTAQANKIGRFTGNAIPFGGAWQTVTADALWLKHYSDPLVEGKGFKIEFLGIRDPLTVDLGLDTTICLGDSVLLSANAGGGYVSDYRYNWSTGANQSSIKVSNTSKSKYWVTLSDACTRLSVQDSVQVDVLPPLSVSLSKDTTLCKGQGTNLVAIASGGLSSGYQYKWSHTGSSASTQPISPATTAQYRVVLSDGCTKLPDTAFQTVAVRPALALNLTATDTVVCINGPISLVAKGSGGDTTGYVYSWDKGLGTGNSKNINISDTISYTVTLTDGCTVTPAIQNIALYTYPPLTLGLTSDTLICLGSGVDLLAVAKGGNGSGFSYSWKHGKNTASISENPLTPTYYVVTASDGCAPDMTDSVLVNLRAPLSLSKLTDTTLCDGQTLMANLLHTGGLSTAHNISWVPGSVSGYNLNLSPPTGVTNYQAILSDGCTIKNDTISFQITKLAPLSAILNLSPTNICLGDSSKMNFILSGGKVANYVWSLDGTNVAFRSQQIKPISNTSYTLDLTDGCSTPANAKANITINPAASANLSVAPDVSCTGSPVLFKYSSPDAASLKWFFSDGDSADGTGINYNRTFAKAGKYTAEARVVTSLGCSGRFNLVDTVTSVAYPKALFTPTPDVTNIENPDVVFTNSSTGATTYQWFFGDGSISFLSGNELHTYSDTGWFKAELKVSIDPGCSDSMSHWIHIKDVYRLYMPTSFSPDGNNVNDKFLPAGRGIQTFHMTIFNRWGEKVFETRDVNQGWTGIDPNGNPWPPGTYPVLIEILDTQEFRHIEKGTVLILK